MRHHLRLKTCKKYTDKRKPYIQLVALNKVLDTYFVK